MSELVHTKVTEEDLSRLRGRLAESARSEGLLDVAYRSVDSPVGALLLAGTERGLVRVAFDADTREDEVVADLAERVGPRILATPRGSRRLDAAAGELEEYFAGDRRSFDLPLDTRLARGFGLEVIGHLPDIGYGTTASYGYVAGLTSSARAVRAVGTACARNPLPLVLPCHRVVRSDGSIGQYAGGQDRKRFLLDLEAGSRR